MKIAVPWFPLAGAVLGAAGAGIYLAAAHVLPSSVSALLTIVFWTAASAALHQRPAGISGAMVLGVSAVVRWQALDRVVQTPGLLIVCIAAQCVPRSALIVMAWTSRPAGTGWAYELSSKLTTPAALIALAQGLAAALLCGLRGGVVIILGSYVIARLARAYSYKRIGGVSGQSLGLTEQLIEVFILAFFAWAG